MASASVVFVTAAPQTSGLVSNSTLVFGVNGNNNTNNIYQIDTANSNAVSNLTLTKKSLGLGAPTGITIDSVGNLYVANDCNIISKLVLTSGTTYSRTNLTLSGPNSLVSPDGITIDSVGNLYVADTGNGKISKLVLISGTTYSCTNLTLTGDSLDGPQGITIDSVGNLYVSNGASNSISKLVPTGNPNEYSCTTLTLNPNTLSGVRGLTFDSFGDLYIANLSNDTISKIVVSGTSGTVSTYISSGLNQPKGIAFNTLDYLYIGNSANGTIVATTSPSCFNHDTKILCLNKEFQEQYVPIQDLRKGDVVKTYLHGYREIQFIGKGACSNNPCVWYGSMYKMEKTDTNGLFEDLIVTGGHAILVDQVTEEQENAYEPLGVKGFAEKIDDKFLLLAAVSDQFVQLTDNEMYTYYHFVLENDGVDNQKFGIWANGVLSESTTKQHYLMTGFEDL